MGAWSMGLSGVQKCALTIAGQSCPRRSSHRRRGTASRSMFRLCGGEDGRRRRWLDRDEFLDLVGATNLIPGPNSTELAIHIGRARAGWPGLIVAGTCFILPAMLIVLALAWAYVRFGSLPAMTGVMTAVAPVV